MASPRPLVIRRGRLLDGATRKGEPADILIENDTIREIGPSGSKRRTRRRPWMPRTGS